MFLLEILMGAEVNIKAEKIGLLFKKLLNLQVCYYNSREMSRVKSPYIPTHKSVPDYYWLVIPS